MTRRGVIIASTVGLIGGIFGGVVVAKTQGPQPDREQACYLVLKASFQQVWDGKPDSLHGVQPKVCKELPKDVQDRIAIQVITDVSDESGQPK